MAAAILLGSGVGQLFTYRVAAPWAAGASRSVCHVRLCRSYYECCPDPFLPSLLRADIDFLESSPKCFCKLSRRG